MKFMKGLWLKVMRQFTAFLPVADNREGSCQRCGQCCKLPYPCPMLRYDAEGKSRCAVYLFRPPSCRVYPRTRGEQLTSAHCGFSFTDREPGVVDVTLSISAPKDAVDAG